MPLPLLGIASSLFGGGASQSGTAGATAGPVTQSTGAINLGSKYLGRGSVTAPTTNAGAGASVTAPAANNTPLYVLAGVGVLVVALVMLNKGKG